MEMQKKIEYKGQMIEVRGGAWRDEMNSWLYTRIEEFGNYTICRAREVDGGELFAI